jgi:hypothetical protein
MLLNFVAGTHLMAAARQMLTPAIFAAPSQACMSL